MKTFLVILRPIRATFPADATIKEQATIGEHFQYVKARYDGGSLVWCGRATDDNPIGILVILAEDESMARLWAENDPAVLAGIFSSELRPFAPIFHDKGFSLA